MPNQRNVSLSEGCKRYDEAIRAIPKYLYNAEKEPNALLDPTLDKLINGHIEKFMDRSICPLGKLLCRIKSATQIKTRSTITNNGLRILTKGRLQLTQVLYHNHSGNISAANV